MLTLPEMAAWQIKTTRQLLQASILAWDVEDTFYKRHYFSEMYTFTIIYVTRYGKERENKHQCEAHGQRKLNL